MDNEKKQVTYNSSITGETQVTFDIQQYMNNRAMFIGLMCNEDGYEETFGDVTVNLSVAAPNYCGYLNVNDMPDIEKFITCLLYTSRCVSETGAESCGDNPERNRALYSLRQGGVICQGALRESAEDVYKRQHLCFLEQHYQFAFLHQNYHLVFASCHQ